MTTIASYSTLNQYVILASAAITTASSTTVSASTPTPLYGSSATPTGVIDITGATLNNTNATLAQTQLTTMAGLIEALVYTSLTSPAPGSTLPLAPGNYKVTGDLTFNNVTLNLSPGNYYFWATTQIIFTSGTINLNGASASNVYWRAGSQITNAAIIGGNGLAGIFIAASTITINAASVITGNLYAQAAGLTLFGNTINPLTLCFLKGTKILTENGYKNVEDLKVGDNVVTKGSILNNEEVVLSEMNIVKPIKWISKFFASRHDESDLPVCFKAESLGVNLPENDLFVSPGHRVILDENMHVARDLVNGETIVQEDVEGAIEYFHFELDCHSIVVAEGVLSETFLELDDSKRSFQN